MMRKRRCWLRPTRSRNDRVKGFVFLSLEGETGISNVIVNPHPCEKYRAVITREKFLRVARHPAAGGREPPIEPFHVRVVGLAWLGPSQTPQSARREDEGEAPSPPSAQSVQTK